MHREAADVAEATFPFEGITRPVPAVADAENVWNPQIKADTLCQQIHNSVSITLGQQSILQLQLSVFSKINVAVVASSTAEGDAWRRNKGHHSDWGFWIPIIRNYIDGLTDSVKEAEP